MGKKIEIKILNTGARMYQTYKHTTMMAIDRQISTGIAPSARLNPRDLPGRTHLL